MWFIYDAMFLIKVFDKNEINPILREESVNSYVLYYKIKDEIILLPSSKTITFYMMSQVLMENHYTNISFIILRRFIVELTCSTMLNWHVDSKYSFDIHAGGMSLSLKIAVDFITIRKINHHFGYLNFHLLK